MNAVALPNREALADYFADSGFTRGAEIGVGDGVFARVLLDRNPLLFLYGVDPWDDGGGNRRGEASYQAACRTLERYLDRSRVRVLRMLSHEALSEIADGSLDFVFIDAAHDYESVRQDIEGWTPKVRPGGIVSGHDYYSLKDGSVKSGVVRAVDDYVQAHGFELQTTPWDRGNPVRDHWQPCWWFEVPA